MNWKDIIARGLPAHPDDIRRAVDLAGQAERELGLGGFVFDTSMVNVDPSARLGFWARLDSASYPYYSWHEAGWDGVAWIDRDGGLEGILNAREENDAEFWPTPAPAEDAGPVVWMRLADAPVDAAVPWIFARPGTGALGTDSAGTLVVPLWRYQCESGVLKAYRRLMTFTAGGLPVVTPEAYHHDEGCCACETPPDTVLCCDGLPATACLVVVTDGRCAQPDYPGHYGAGGCLAADVPMALEVGGDFDGQLVSDEIECFVGDVDVGGVYRWRAYCDGAWLRVVQDWKVGEGEWHLGDSGYGNEPSPGDGGGNGYAFQPAAPSEDYAFTCSPFYARGTGLYHGNNTSDVNPVCYAVYPLTIPFAFELRAGDSATVTTPCCAGDDVPDTLCVTPTGIPCTPHLFGITYDAFGENGAGWYSPVFTCSGGTDLYFRLFCNGTDWVWEEYCDGELTGTVTLSGVVCSPFAASVPQWTTEGPCVPTDGVSLVIGPCPEDCGGALSECTGPTPSYFKVTVAGEPGCTDLNGVWYYVQDGGAGPVYFRQGESDGNNQLTVFDGPDPAVVSVSISNGTDTLHCSAVPMPACVGAAGVSSASGQEGGCTGEGEATTFTVEGFCGAPPTPGTIDTACCPDDLLPESLWLTYPSGPCAGSYPLTWSAPNSWWETTGGIDFHKFYCDSGTWKLLDGIPSVLTAVSVACDPLEVTFSTPLACGGVAPTVTAEAP